MLRTLRGPLRRVAGGFASPFGASISSSAGSLASAAAAQTMPQLPENLILDSHALGLLREGEAEDAAATTAEDVSLPTSLPIYSVSSQEAAGTDGAASGPASFSSVTATGSDAELSPSVWHQPLRPDLVHRVLVWQQKNARTTLYKTKDRAETRGGGKKPWRQKGTGRARHASIRSPLWKGGGVAHGPVFRDWSISLPKKIRALGLRVALSSKLRDGRLVVVESLPDFAVVGSSNNPDDVDTLAVKARDIKGFVEGVLDNLQGYAPPRSLKASSDSAEDGAAGTAAAAATVEDKRERHGSQNAQPSVLVVDVDIPAPLFKGCSNLKRVKCLPVKGLNVKEVAWSHTLVVTRPALKLINEALDPLRDRERHYDAIAEEVLA